MPRPPVTHAQCRGAPMCAPVDNVDVRHSLPFGRSGLVSRKSHSLFREIKSAISLFSGRWLDWGCSALTYRILDIADLTRDFRSCVSRERFDLSVRVFLAPLAQRGLCPHALRAPLQGQYELVRTVALDLGKGLTPPLATGVFVLQRASSFYYTCGQFTLSKSCGAKRPHIRPPQADTFNSQRQLVGAIQHS